MELNDAVEGVSRSEASQKPELKMCFGDDGDTDRWIRKFQSMQSGNTPRQDASKGLYNPMGVPAVSHAVIPSPAGHSTETKMDKANRVQNRPRARISHGTLLTTEGEET